MIGIMVIAALCFLATSLMLLGFAYAIGVKGMVRLISGYKPGGDDAGLARFMSRWLCVLAAIMVLHGLSFLFAKTNDMIVAASIAPAVTPLPIVVIMLKGASKFQSRTDSVEQEPAGSDDVEDRG